MRIAVLFNPASGRGAGAGAAAEVERALAADGHTVSLFTREQGSALAASEFDALVIVGGDGTVHHALPLLVEKQAAVYHYPMGTENLFAREFGMKRSAAVLAGAVRTGERRRVDLARVNGQFFALMVSVGPDAGVVHRLDKSRRGPIRHMSYLRPILEETLAPSLPAVTVEIDGRAVVEGRRGMVVVANSRQYGLRVDPAHKASMTDGLLDVVFFPAEGSLAIMAWLLAARCGRHASRRGLVYEQGRAVTVRAEDAVFQGDGEAGRGVVNLSIECVPRALTVIEP